MRFQYNYSVIFSLKILNPYTGIPCNFEAVPSFLGGFTGSAQYPDFINRSNFASKNTHRRSY